jgi:hypothetical protein
VTQEFGPSTESDARATERPPLGEDKQGPLALLLEELAALRKEVHRSATRDVRRLLSFRQAAAALGVSRTRTLPLLIERGLLKPVAVGGRKRIPSAQIEQLAFEGFEVAGPAHRRSKPARKRPAGTSAASVRALKLF